ncbi:flagellar export chaperone FlgN [Bowmanella pacifica]|uniref:Flagellar protein FlgN n=1 Tax=Bowmanella pacifica TaxID=502051 RepID=A0A917YXF8_9ALTE|nr:flagellar export chaperone FlgN [Bowmanella pacifica]GGO69301.1 hypothetical protein GCM10010982_20110 [Bowmanella pacifica]
MSINSVKGFIASLRDDLANLNQLIYAQEKQYELLSRRESSQLTHLNQDILATLETLRRSNEHREQYLQELGLTPDKAGAQHLKERLPSPLKEATARLLEELAMKSSVCSMMNERAGRLLANQRQLLNRLTGAPSQQDYPQFPIPR